MPSPVDPKIRELAERVIAEGKNKRAIAVLEVLLDKGAISTDDIQALGYNHPPRAVGDVRDAGIPLITGSATSQTGKRMAVYTFGRPSDVQDGRVGGRSALPRAFKLKLLQRYGAIDCVTGAKLDERILQIDHRIPYRIAGDVGLADHNVDDYMLLDASSQRAKSWSCEHCPNMHRRELATCRTCFWAWPESYTHIATVEQRRVELVWQGDEVAAYDALRLLAEKRSTTVAELLKGAVRQIAKDS